MSPSWYDDSLRVESDSRWRAQYRLLQSWHRETVLHEPPAVGSNGKLVGSMLSETAGTAGKNFLTKDTASRSLGSRRSTASPSALPSTRATCMRR